MSFPCCEPASRRPMTIFQRLGMEDINKNGVIERTACFGYCPKDEGYKAGVDIDSNGIITESEAKYYLLTFMSLREEQERYDMGKGDLSFAIDPIGIDSDLRTWELKPIGICDQLKQEYSLTSHDKTVLLESFRKKLDVLQQKTSFGDQHVPFGIVSLEMAKAGLFEDAIVTAKRIVDLSMRSYALQLIAEEMIKSGFDRNKILDVLKKALEIIPTELLDDSILQMTADSAKERATMRISIAMARIGFFREALDVARSIENLYTQTQTIIHIAREMAKYCYSKEEVLEIFVESLQIADRAKQSHGISGYKKLLGHISVAMAKAGYFKEAVTLAQSMSGPKFSNFDRLAQTEATQKIAIEMGRAGLYYEALNLIRSVEPYFRVLPLSLIAVEMAKSKLFSKEEIYDIFLEALYYVKEDKTVAPMPGDVISGMRKACLSQREIDWLLKRAGVEAPL